CCGRTDGVFPSVSTQIYCCEWERRPLRDVVHPAIAGCHGSCALANVVLLLFDGHALWFHSVNADPLVLILYDYIEALLRADAPLPPPSSLADLQFSGSR